MYMGAAAGVSLFRWLDPASVAWMRVCSAGLVFLAVARPSRAGWTGSRLLWASTFGVVIALMNVSFYIAISRLPLGTVVAIEFLGPIAVASIGSRSVRDGLSVLAALAGVVLIADVHIVNEPLGLLFAGFAGLFLAGYIALGKRVSDLGNPRDSLAVGFVVATLITSPLLAFDSADWQGGGIPIGRVIVLGFAVGLLSNVIPHALDQVILKSAGRGYFSILLALLPVTATVVGALALRQLPSFIELSGIAAIVVAIVTRSTNSGIGADEFVG
jgi:inner membrane transporter RhtA